MNRTHLQGTLPLDEPMGGSEVSVKHTNFIINLGDATATEIAGLIDLIQDRVERHSGIRLQPEVRRVGTFS